MRPEGGFAVVATAFMDASCSCDALRIHLVSKCSFVELSNTNIYVLAARALFCPAVCLSMVSPASHLQLKKHKNLVLSFRPFDKNPHVFVVSTFLSWYSVKCCFDDKKTTLLLGREQQLPPPLPSLVSCLIFSLS